MTRQFKYARSVHKTLEHKLVSEHLDSDWRQQKLDQLSAIANDDSLGEEEIIEQLEEFSKEFNNSFE